ncbi:ubiquinol-cytochrome-c reductase complex assembly factor 4 [Molothrus ater]|uniref:ubiquinol-cytochrome-c reductase complex assembly factor 4 n=1 Tax=Molothrus ater TaxID=84834 RepID=UPI0023E7556F|nr:ubiquinol-cytochrome-c reductase complex assembly factor 4 [Molothrus ater]
MEVGQNLTERCNEITELLQKHSCGEVIPGNSLYVIQNKMDSSNTNCGSITVAIGERRARHLRSLCRLLWCGSAPPGPGSCRPCPHGGSCVEPRPNPPSPRASAPAHVKRGMIRALGRWRVRRAPCLPGPRRGLARRRNPEGAEGGGPIPFCGSKASPRFWSVSRSMGNDHERPSVRVLPLSVLSAELLLWCVFRENGETDERLEAVLFGQIVDSDTAQESSAPLQLLKEN